MPGIVELVNRPSVKGKIIWGASLLGVVVGVPIFLGQVLHIEINWTKVIEHVLYVFEIFLACLFLEILVRRYDRWKDRDLDINCDNCEKPKPLKRAPGTEKRWLCRDCMKSYIVDHEAEFIEAGITTEEIRKASSGYRRRKRVRKK